MRRRGMAKVTCYKFWWTNREKTRKHRVSEVATESQRRESNSAALYASERAVSIGILLGVTKCLDFRHGGHDTIDHKANDGPGPVRKPAIHSQK